MMTLEVIQRCRSVKGAVWGVVVLAVLSSLVPQKSGSTARKPPPTFNKDVAPILFKNCAKCHQTGELASKIPLLSYGAAFDRAASIREMVSSRQMPPWPADPSHSLKFRNDARLSQAEIDTIVGWVDGGKLKGNDADLPSIPETQDGWIQTQGRKPDLVISLPGDMHIPAEGAFPYARMLVKVPFTEDRWVAASQTRPSNPSVVHHMALTEVALPDGMSPAQAEETAGQLGVSDDVFIKAAVTAPTSSSQPDMLSIYTPGSTLETYKDGSSKLLRGGENMYVIFNIHYTTTGKPEIDRSKIALWFTPNRPDHQLFRVNGAGETVIARGKELLTDTPGITAEGTHVVIPPIEPYEANYELTGITAYQNPVTIYQFHPHAHYRGKDFTYSVVYPDGREETVLSVPRFDHRWQMTYELEEPLKLPAGSKLVVTAHYDNSKTKMHNPAPEKDVYFLAMNQSWDEMFTPFIQYSIDSKVPLAQEAPGSKSSDGALSEGRESTGDVLQIGEVVGCLVTDSSGGWLLQHANQPVMSQTQASSSSELEAAKDRPSGNEQYRLLGTRVFNPANHAGERVAVKGVLLGEPGDFRLNVTSLQAVGVDCMQ
jgi:Copper type II ascorbate-dependent monooxygenase, C-terminal domain